MDEDRAPAVILWVTLAVVMFFAAWVVSWLVPAAWL